MRSWRLGQYGFICFKSDAVSLESLLSVEFARRTSLAAAIVTKSVFLESWYALCFSFRVA